MTRPRGRAGARGSASSPVLLLLAAVLAGGLVVRLWNNDYGLPYVYNYDEETHFTSRAVEMFGGGFDPDYYQNPSGFTYIVHAALRLLYGDWPLIGSILELPLDTVGTQFELDPTPIWIISRSLAALLAVAGVVAVFYVGRRLWGTRVGLVAAAVLSFAFLPVAYGRIAVTDVGTLAPVALAVYAAIRVYEDGARRHYLLAGAMVGLAIGFKYTAGLVLLPLLGAVALRSLAAAPEPRTARALAGRVRATGARGSARFLLALRHRSEARSFALALAALAAVFFVTTPFFFLDPISALYQLKTQAEAAGGAEKLGQTSSSGALFYLGSLTWGLGFAGVVAALAGAAIVWRRG
ncbi:MAG TPA: glycosyltransferase family 39 protein, partial [Thermoleophilaceae bacterium]|nr:glycosyltransferase family 39 protein [Thermoleophilaceae bacterium]